MNSVIFLGAEIKVFFPYFYAFYAYAWNSDIKNYNVDDYDAFINWLRYFFQRTNILGAQISEDGFDFYANYFRDTPEIVEQKIAYGGYYLVKDYIEGLNTEYDYEFERVKEYVKG